MNTDTSHTRQPSGEQSLPANTIFELLVTQRRRYVLYYLSQAVGTVTLTELATEIERCEHPNEVPHGYRLDSLGVSEQLERICTDLHHTHLPKLVAANVVRYDVETETIEPLEAMASLESYLDLALCDDLATSS